MLSSSDGSPCDSVTLGHWSGKVRYKTGMSITDNLVYWICYINPQSAKFNKKKIIHLKLCLAFATHKFKLVRITHNNLIRDQTFANLEV